MPNYTYSRDFPAGNQTPAAQRTTLTTNTNSVDSILAVDLIGFNDADGGYHSKSTYVVQGADPGSASGQVVEYSKTSSGSSEIFLQRDGAATPIQMTKGTIVNTVAGSQSFLPGGLILKMGRATTISGQIIFANVGLSNFTTCYGAVITGDNTANPNIISVSPSSIQTSNGGTIGVFFMAWGI